MGEYIFYTTEGFTLDPKGVEVDNCQVLGCAFGADEHEARMNLLKENPWIEEHGYDTDELVCRTLAQCRDAEERRRC